MSGSDRFAAALLLAASAVGHAADTEIVVHESTFE